MIVSAISSANLYSKTNSQNENLRSDTKFYSNSIQPKDQVAFTSIPKRTYSFSPEAAKAIDEIISGGIGLHAKVNNIFKPVTDKKLLSPNTTAIIYRQPETRFISDMIGIINKCPLLKEICYVKPNANGSISLNIINIPTDSQARTTLVTKLGINQLRFPKLSTPEFLPTMAPTYDIEGFNVTTAVK